MNGPVETKEQWFSDWNFYRPRVAEFCAPPYPARSGEILFVGDSITAGCDWKTKLGRDDVWNYGIPGDKTFGVAYRSWMFKAFPPRQIFLLIGINDLRYGWPKDKMKINYLAMLKKLRLDFPECEIFVESMLPVNFVLSNEEFIKSNREIKQLNEIIAADAADCGCRYLDIHDLFLDTEGQMDARYADDGLHLNDCGHDVWIKALREYIR